MRKLLYQDVGQIDFVRRGFRLGPARGRLEAAGLTLLAGFNVVNEAGLDGLDLLSGIAPEMWGYACEGAAVACVVHDVLTLSRGRRLAALLAGPGRDHPYLVHMGAGWAFARLRLRPLRLPGALDPLLRWLTWDGYGFHQAFFRQPVGLTSNGVRRAIRDQGYGRAVWFRECADVEAVATTIAAFPLDRHADLWAGAGLAAAYVGGATSDDLVRLARHAGENRADLAQGAVFAAAARVRAGFVPGHTEQAAEILAGTACERAAAWTEEARRGRGGGPEEYMRWQAEVRRLWGSRRNARIEWL
ncbi:DUF1702 family protein [Nonomuraea typhae]|uniref:DUF1702 family protein n=1 Tax=Nonomuraea typhae TaxID=2603600 RepID=UPI0012FB09E4|nr:DUF1702 family protein [Nonomuraea typhae]